MPPIDPAELVRGVRKDEAWIDTAESFRIRLEGRWTRTTEAIAISTADLKRKFPSTEISEARFPELNPQTHEKIDLGFDRRRMHVNIESQDGGRVMRKSLWDGQLEFTHEKYSSGQEHYSLAKNHEHLARFFIGNLPCFRAGPHRYWWEPRGGPGRPEDCRLAGRGQFRGHDCWVVETEILFWTYYIGVEDRRLHGLTRFVLPRGYESRSWPIEQRIASEFGHPVSSKQEYKEWEKSLPKDEKVAMLKRYYVAIRPIVRPQFTHFFDDYQELAPSCWLPMKMGYDHWGRDSEPAAISATREMRVISVELNQPLPDSLFEISMNEGVRLFDRRYDPPLGYTYRKGISAEEMDAIIADARQKQEEMNARVSAQNAVVGTIAPSFPPGQWLNSPPLTWPDLRGKVVILDFWSDRCGPCRSYLPMSVDIHKERQTTGIVIIGIHTAGSSLESVQKLMKEFDITYPVCIDTPPPQGEVSFGKFFGQLGVSAIPNSIVVDQGQKVVAHGDLPSTLAKARELAQGN